MGQSSLLLVVIALTVSKQSLYWTA